MLLARMIISWTLLRYGSSNLSDWLETDCYSAAISPLKGLSSMPWGLHMTKTSLRLLRS